MHPYLDIQPSVLEAMADAEPVVALESTVIAHGLPWPTNLETAHAMQTAVRSEGAVPAVIAVADGRIRVGLDDAALEDFAKGSDIRKASRRDLAALLAGGTAGATTVAATMVCAHMAGIEVFATGGIGGVHRGAEESFDVSADLRELGRTPVAVVCSGAKSILDLPKTMEVLETEGVPVVGFATDTFPAFHVRDSGLPVGMRADTPEKVAAIIAANRAIGGGVLVANPIPESDAIPRDEVESWIAQALAEARANDITGKDVTPYLLRQMASISEGRTLAANTSLLRNNAAAAGRIAVALAKRE